VAGAGITLRGVSRYRGVREIKLNSIGREVTESRICENQRRGCSSTVVAVIASGPIPGSSWLGEDHAAGGGSQTTGGAALRVDVTNPPAHNQNAMQRRAGSDDRKLEITMNNLAKLTFTVPETASLLGISRAHAFELVARKELPAVRLVRRVVVHGKRSKTSYNTAGQPDRRRRCLHKGPFSTN
jgi:excisionase family DNA binding protein